MWGNLEAEIGRAARRRVAEYERHAQWVFDENARRVRRSVGSPQLLPLQRPEIWSRDPAFDPFYVRSRRGAIALSIAQALKGHRYTPFAPAGFEVPKRSGGSRLVSAFAIADEVVSNRVYRSLLAKNTALLSARSYAYRPDLTPHDAILHVRAELRREQRVFVAEYDFSKFFDMVSHDHIWSTLDALGIVRTPLEEELIRAFLQAPEPTVETYVRRPTGTARRRGLPQGTSVSLFLANIAAAPLDRALERIGVGFVRYADDTLIWSPDYGRICAAVDALHEASTAIGADINVEKSLGVRLLVPENTRYVEMESTKEIHYLGHTLGLRRLQMKPESVARVKSRVAQLLFANLLREPMSGTQDLARLTTTDRDYATYLWQLRRYLYGPLSERDVRRFLKGSVPPMSFQGVMSFFPLVDDDEVLAELDEWIASQTWLALRKRQRLLAGFVSRRPVPWGLTKEEMIRTVTVSGTSGREVDLRLPSVRRISGVIRTAVEAYGVGVVSRGGALYLYDDRA